MKAIVHTRYGSPDVLQLQEVEKPVPKHGEVLVQVHAASVNALDWHRMRGQPFLVRAEGGLRKPKNPRLGVDLAGRVEAVGANVTRFRVGDDVFGIGRGAFAEFACAAEDNLVLKPTNISYLVQRTAPGAAGTLALACGRRVRRRLAARSADRFGHAQRPPRAARHPCQVGAGDPHWGRGTLCRAARPPFIR